MQAQRVAMLLAVLVVVSSSGATVVVGQSSPPWEGAVLEELQAVAQAANRAGATADGGLLFDQLRGERATVRVHDAAGEARYALDVGRDGAIGDVRRGAHPRATVRLSVTRGTVARLAASDDPRALLVAALRGAIPERHTLAGQVDWTGTPPADAAVVLVDADGGRVVQPLDDAGRFRFTDLPDRVYGLEVRVDGSAFPTYVRLPEARDGEPRTDAPAGPPSGDGEPGEGGDGPEQGWPPCCLEPLPPDPSGPLPTIVADDGTLVPPRAGGQGDPGGAGPVSVSPAELGQPVHYRGVGDDGAERFVVGITGGETVPAAAPIRVRGVGLVNGLKWGLIDVLARFV